MLYFINEKKECTGCSACMNVCPQKCISMKFDEEGFLYPVENETCIHCGLCEKVCEEKKQIQGKVNIVQSAYAGISKDNSVWKRSSSGGAFSEICEVWRDNNTYIFGASWNGILVEHRGIENGKSVALLCGSKYIESYIGDSFSKIQALLREKKKVVFCGTPCQIAGLRSCLKRDYDELLLIDFVCHGVGSTLVFQDCLTLLEKQFGKKIKSYRFRAKNNVFEKRYLQEILFEDGQKMFIEGDPYMQLFLSQKCLRPSCGKNCLYRTANRQSDITLADYKQLTKDFPELIGIKKNFSAIIFNTDKANMLLDELKKRMIIIESTMDSIKRDNPLFYTQTNFSKEREKFFEEYCHNSKKALEKYTVEAKRKKVGFIKFVFNILPVFMRREIYKIFRK